MDNACRQEKIQEGWGTGARKTGFSLIKKRALVLEVLFGRGKMCTLFNGSK
jgi:hypothetical protein